MNYQTEPITMFLIAALGCADLLFMGSERLPRMILIWGNC